MKLEKFDLEKVIHGAKVVTRDGREVLELTKFELKSEFCMVGVLSGEINAWTEKGEWDYHKKGSPSDLFIAVEPQSIWVNVLKINGHIGLGAIGYTKEEAKGKNIYTDSYIKTIEITDEPE